MHEISSQMSLVQVKGEGEVGDCLLRMGREDPSLDQMGHPGKAFLCSAWSPNHHSHTAFCKKDLAGISSMLCDHLCMMLESDGPPRWGLHSVINVHIQYCHRKTPIPYRLRSLIGMSLLTHIQHCAQHALFTQLLHIDQARVCDAVSEHNHHCHIWFKVEGTSACCDLGLFYL